MPVEDFSPPFGESSERRLPTATERDNGFPCGAADQALFNGMFHLLEGQFKHLIDQAGVTPNQEGDPTTNYRAIQALIDAATGDNPLGYVLMSQARARLPIFPEILSADGRINPTAPATGTVRVPGGVDIVHRGIYLLNSTQTDLLTDASKTYHLRWDLSTDTLSLQDLASASYNASSASEKDIAFDSDFDDALLARVITNSSNIAAITSLSNKPRLFSTAERNASVGDAGANGVTKSYTYDFARTPLCMLESTWPPGTFRDSDLRVEVTARSRYAMTVRSWNWTRDIVGSNHNSPGYRYNIMAV
ncbi:MAG: hypothetical protein A49_27800 [Methyloceanibacter sp.]|nr:MAG: hypothetical protein A49_27800 [Methyloceanibacter sp.]